MRWATLIPFPVDQGLLQSNSCSFTGFFNVFLKSISLPLKTRNICSIVACTNHQDVVSMESVSIPWWIWRLRRHRNISPLLLALFLGIFSVLNSAFRPTSFLSYSYSLNNPADRTILKGFNLLDVAGFQEIMARHALEHEKMSSEEEINAPGEGDCH